MVIQKTEEVKVKKMSPKIDRSRPQTSLIKFNNIQKGQIRNFWLVRYLWLLFCLFLSIISKTSYISVSKYVHPNKYTFEICYSILHNILIYTLEHSYTRPKIYNPKIFKITISPRSWSRTKSFYSIHNEEYFSSDWEKYNYTHVEVFICL